MTTAQLIQAAHDEGVTGMVLIMLLIIVPGLWLAWRANRSSARRDRLRIKERFNQAVAARRHA
ncbi:MAG: hypothetical protein KKE73_03785 [Proteobacteria bacterium]|nr:hypothetical protein [Pseudomonadota bacterium]